MLMQAGVWTVSKENTTCSKQRHNRVFAMENRQERLPVFYYPCGLFMLIMNLGGAVIDVCKQARRMD